MWAIFCLSGCYVESVAWPRRTTPSRTRSGCPTTLFKLSGRPRKCWLRLALIPIRWKRLPAPGCRLPGARRRTPLLSFRFYQQAGYVIVLRGCADEEVEFGHQAVQHLARRCRCRRVDDAQKLRFAVLFLMRIFGFH